MEHTCPVNKCEYEWAFMVEVQLLPNRLISIGGLSISGSTIAGVACHWLCSHSMILTCWNTNHSCIILTLSAGSSIASNRFLYLLWSFLYLQSCLSLMLTAAWRSQESRADGFLWSLPRGIKTVEGLLQLSRPAIWGVHFLSSHFWPLSGKNAQNGACECLTSFR